MCKNKKAMKFPFKQPIRKEFLNEFGKKITAYIYAGNAQYKGEKESGWNIIPLEKFYNLIDNKKWTEIIKKEEEKK
jgi:hypothetical protein